MTPFKLGFALSLAAVLCGCHTVLEAVSPNDTTTGYRKTTNSNGETVYQRERYVGPSYGGPGPLPTPTPLPTPIPTPFPVVVEPAPLLGTEPVQDNNLVVRRAEPVQLSDTAKSDSVWARGWAFGAEASSDSKRAHVGALVFKELEWVEAKAGISLFSADKDLYAGFDLGLRPMLKIADDVSIFGGAGVYGGDAKRCTYDNSIESCEKRFLFAGYLEAGVYLWNFSLFARSYNIEEAGKKIPSDTFLGIGLRTSY